MPVDNVITANPLSAEALRQGVPGAQKGGLANGFFNNMFGALRRIFPSGPLAGEYGVKSSQPVLSPFQANPVMEPNPQTRPAQTTAALGGSGTPIYAGFVTDLGEYNGKLQGINAFPIYEQMRRTDPDVHAGLLATKLPIRCAQYEVVPGVTAASPLHGMATEIADFVRENLFGGLETQTSTGFYHSQTFESVLENTLLKLDFGCAAHEILWTVDRDKVRIRKLAPRLPMTFYRFYPDTDGETLLAMEQYGYRGDEYVNVIIPSEKLDYFSYDKEGADFYGRALALDTPVPSPDGWKTMGTLQVGDRIFDEQGQIRHVTAKSQVWKDRPCYELKFSTGYTLVADANHLWYTRTAAERHARIPGKVRTTDEISKTIHDKHNGKAANHSVSRTQPLQYAHQHNLLVPPYILGFWLADGSQDSSQLHCHEKEVEFLMAELRAAGYAAQDSTPNGKKEGKGRQICAPGLITQLRAMGLHCNKHIPEAYLCGDIKQRTDLLAGLMDGDGTANIPNAQCSFSNTNKQLALDTCTLVASLGELPIFACKRKRHHKRPNWSTAWEVRFTPEVSPFRMPWKTAIVRPAAGKKWTRTLHYIQRATPVESRDTVCIEVDSPSHLFLVGRTCMPTHNSSLRYCYSPWYIKSNIIRLDAVAIERNGMGIPVIELAENADDEDKAYAQRFVTMVATHEQTGLTIPFGYQFKLVGMTGRIRDPKNSIQFHSEQILRSFLAGFIAFGTTQTGSRSLSQDQTTFFKLGLNAIARNTTGTMSNSSIRRLVDFNYGDSRKQIPYPRLVHSNIAALDPMELAEKIKNLAQWQVDLVQPDDELENWFRHEYGLPPKTTMRSRWMPVQQRIMEQPAPGITPDELESGKDPGGPKPVVDPIHPTQGANPPHPGTPAKGNYDPGTEPNPHRTTASKVDPVANVKAAETVELALLLAETQHTAPDKKIVCWDFDGVVSIFDNPEERTYVAGEFGSLSPNAKLLMEKLNAAGFTNVIVTARKDIDKVKKWVEARGLPVKSVGNEKVPALCYVDDRGIRVKWGTDANPDEVTRVLKALKKIAKDHGDRV